MIGDVPWFLALIREVMSACGCYPNYIDAMKVILVQIYQDRNATNADDLLNATRPCNFLEHAVCVSTIMDHFAIPKFKCLPGIFKYKFQMTTRWWSGAISTFFSLRKSYICTKVNSICENKSKKSQTYAFCFESNWWYWHYFNGCPACRNAKL